MGSIYYDIADKIHPNTANQIKNEVGQMRMHTLKLVQGATVLRYVQVVKQYRRSRTYMLHVAATVTPSPIAIDENDLSVCNRKTIFKICSCSLIFLLYKLYSKNTKKIMVVYMCTKKKHFP